jgi:hypothetical protein
MIKLAVNGAELDVWRSAASAMPTDRIASLTTDLWELAHDGFPATAASATEQDLIHHFLEPTFGGYQFVHGRLRAMTAAEVFNLKRGRALYFSLSAIHSSLRGQGFYQQMLLLRIAIGNITGCEWWATRTQSPIVAHSFSRYDCYPWSEDSAAANVASEVAEVLHENFKVLGHREGQEFEPATGVLRRAYPLSPYTIIPAIENVRVQAHFDTHVDRDSGDALLLVGRLDALIAVLASRCEAHFSVSFDELCDRLRFL